MRINTASRLLAFSCFGCVLLLIYQVVFMTRTSANRDWNHLHNSKFTLPSLQRFVLRNVSEASLNSKISKLDQLDPDSYNSIFPTQFRQAGSPYTSKELEQTRLVSHVSCDGVNIQLPLFEKLFGFKDVRGSSLSQLVLSYGEVSIHYFEEGISLDDKISEAKDKNKKALIYVVPSDWIPNYGFRIYDIPVIVLHTLPHKFEHLALSIDTANRVSWSPMEWKIHGYAAETIIVGDSRGTPESTAILLEVAKSFESLISLGWKPLRTIHFVSFAQYTAEQWAFTNKKWIDRRAVAYIDCTELQNRISTSISSSPSLEHITTWAAQQLLEAGLIKDFSHSTTFASPLGSNSFLFDLLIPSISVTLDRGINDARYIALLIATLAQDSVIPFHMTGYAPFAYDSPSLENIASKFDNEVELLREAFTSEYPWYQFTAKLKAIARRKHVNLIMNLFERQMVNSHGRHLLFSNNKSGTQTIVNKNQTKINQVFEKAFDSLLKFS